MFNEIWVVWLAFVRMLGWAAANPVSSLVQIVLSPIHIIRHLRKLLGALIAVVALGACIEIWFPKNATWLFVITNIILLTASVTIIWRATVFPLLFHFGGGVASTHGTARFATDWEQRHLSMGAKDQGLIIGRNLRTGELMQYPGPAHLITMAPTRSGKGVGTIIPNLLLLNRSILCIDPKGENAAIAARARIKFGATAVLDPFGITAAPSSRYNPLENFDPNSPDVTDDAASIAEAIVHDDHSAQGEVHWNEEAKALITGLILHLISIEEAEDKNLGRLREYLTLEPKKFVLLLEEMQNSKACNGLVARAANRHLGKSDREAAGVLSSAQRHTHFLDSPRISESLSTCDLRFADLKTHVCTIFLVLPPDKIDTYARWLRLMITQSLNEMTKVRLGIQSPVLFLMDEFAALGRLPAVERAFGLMAGYGVQLWPILQDIHQLRDTYGRKAGTFLSNAGALQVFGVNDQESADLVSHLLGQSTVVFTTASRNLDSQESGLSVSEHHTGRPLLTPDEVRRLSPELELLFLAGEAPHLAGKLKYYSDPEFVGRFDKGWSAIL